MKLKKSFSFGMTVLLCFICAALTASSFVFVLSCADPGGTSGGEGADFDASSYYTKSEVDAMLPEHSGTTLTVNDSSTDYSSGLGVTKPPNYRYLLLQFDGGNPSTECALCIGDSGSDYSNIVSAYTPDMNQPARLLFFNLELYGSDLRIWAEGLDSGKTINTYSFIWFR